MRGFTDPEDLFLNLGQALKPAFHGQIATRNLDETRLRTAPGWLTLNAEALKATVVRLPTREEMEQGVNEQLIVEFYSRF